MADWHGGGIVAWVAWRGEGRHAALQNGEIVGRRPKEAAPNPPESVGRSGGIERVDIKHCRLAIRTSVRKIQWTAGLSQCSIAMRWSFSSFDLPRPGILGRR